MPLIDCTLLEKKNRSRKTASPESKKSKTSQPEGWKSTDTCDISNTSYTDSGSIPVDQSNNNFLEVSQCATNSLPSSTEKSNDLQHVITPTELTPPHDRMTSADFDDNNQQKVPCF